MHNMNYRSVVFAMPNGMPGVVQYGIQVMQEADERQVAVHIRQVEDSVDFHENATARDTVFNRVLELELKSISVRYIRLLVSSLEKMMEYQFAAFTLSKETAGAGLVRQPIDVYTSDIRAGEIWLSSVNPRFVSNAA